MPRAATVSVRKERFLSDSPFRALCIGSAETIASLRRKAGAAEKAAKVGLAPDVPLTELLGPTPLEEVSQLLRSLATDGKRRTCYRIMWPLSTSGITPLLENSELRATQPPGAESAQLLFLSSWLAYLRSSSPVDAAGAFERWEELYTCEEMDERLVELLVEEGELDRGSAYNVVVEAQRAVALALLSRVSEDVASSWDEGQTSKAALLLEAVLNSPLDEELEELALEPIADSAHRLKERVELRIKEAAEWRQGSSTEPPREVVQLERIAGALKGRLPSALDWESTAHRWTTALVWRMRQESLRLNHADDNAAALEIARAALKLANTTEQNAKIREDLGQLEEIVADEKAEAAYAGIERVSSAPSLGTLNGFGFKVYGREPFPADRGLYFTILYFTAAFIPIFPISRYLVKDGDRGGWHFLGKTRWTLGMKMHLGVSCLLILLLCVYFANNDSSASGSRNASDSSSYNSSNSPPSDSPNTGDSLTPALTPSPADTTSTDASVGTDKAPSTSREESRKNIDYSKWLAEQDAREKKRDRLEKELDSLTSEIAALQSQINNEGSSLDEQRSTLNILKAEIDASDPNPYNQAEIDDHNVKVQRYEGLRAEFNERVYHYNRKVNQEKKEVRRHNEIADALDASR